LNNSISNKDKKAWENFLSSTEKLPNKDIKTKKKNFLKSKSFDLHGHTLDDANKEIERLILQSYNEGVHKLTIVTGKGLHSENKKNPFVSQDLSILKNSVPYFIKNNSRLMNLIKEIQEAKIEDGGSGAFYIFLKKKY
tara:strand:+ start:1039 stop:1452 length:414 start_codon:yes stop_codon:yes gene_type:complete